jgi:putative ABC transport system permease protein
MITSQRGQRPPAVPGAGAPVAGHVALPAPRASARRGSFAGLLTLARWRLREGWRSLLALGLGVLAAVVIFAAVPLVSGQTAALGLQGVLADADLGRDIQLSAPVSPFSTASLSSVDSGVRQLASGTIAPYTPTQSASLISDPLLLAQAGSHRFDLSAGGATAAQLLSYDYAQTAAHMRLTAGRVPTHAGEALVTTEMAGDFGLQPGSTLTLTPYGGHTHQLTLRVVGVWTPRNPDERFWMGRGFLAAPGASGAPTYPVLAARSTLLAAGASLGVGGSDNWTFYLAPDRVTVANSSDAAQRVATFRARAQDSQTALGGAQGVEVTTTLDDLLGGFASQRDAILLPLYVVAAQVLGLILFYVVSMAGMLADRQGAALAVMKSRGTARGQILATYALQGLVVSLVAVALGPWLAVALAHWLVGILMGTGATSAWAPPPLEALLAAAAAGVLGLGVMVLATLAAARRDILAFRRESARPSRPPLWQRLYLDVLLALMCAAGYYELGQGGGVTATGAPDVLLLLAPGLLLLAGALLVARAFPWAARFASTLAARGRGAPALLALTQIARTPSRYIRLALLVTLAVGLGLFTLTFSSSIDQRLADRAAYTAGSDLRVTLSSGADPRAPGRLAALPGIVHSTQVSRDTVALPVGEGTHPVQLLAVDPATFARVAAWRDDYASTPLPSLLTTMSTHSDASGATLWALVDTTFLERTHARLGDTVQVTPTDNPGVTLRVVVGAEVSAFPTLEPGSDTGFLVIALAPYQAALGANNPGAPLVANEVWMTSADATASLGIAHRARSDATLDVASIYDARALLRSGQHNPLTVGLRGMLLLGVAVSLGLALIGTVVASAFGARQRTVQFATLRALGASARQVSQLLLTEQGVVYVIGLLAGTALGALASIATEPLLAYADFASGTQGGPPYVLSAAPGPLVIFYLAVLVAAAISLLVSAGYLRRLRPANALRLNED